MPKYMSRRTACFALGTAGLGGLTSSLWAADENAPTSHPVEANFAGTWTYRSFLNNPDIKVDFDKLEFARATLTVETSQFGVLRGRLSFGDDYLALKGNIAYGNPFSARFQGNGATKATKGWIYNYIGLLVPSWPDGVKQRPAIVGSVIRTVPHSDGMAKAGEVASFIAVKQDS